MRGVLGNLGRRSRRSVLLSAVAAGLALSVVALGISEPTPASAHCDSVNGPVVGAAELALKENNVDLVLPYVQPESEAELTRVFEHTQEVRKLGGDAEALADRYFFETAVRLHRIGEGASYTGLTTESDFGPALAEADRALETGSAVEVSHLLEQAVREGVTEKYRIVEETREIAAREGTVAAHRERAEAELLFEKYVLELYETAKGTSVAPEGSGETVGHASEAQMVDSHSH